MNLKTIFASFKNRDMQKRILIIFGIIAIYRFLAHVPVPLAEPTQFKEIVENVINTTDFGGFLNLISGGALTSFSIILVGLSPYITASIITQLLTKAIPRLEELHNDGESGRRKINQWTRVITVPLAILQSIAYIFILRQTVLAGNAAALPEAGATAWVVAITAMAAGSVILMWLGELITEQGIGNGISMIIFASIISQLPRTVTTLGTSITNTSQSGGLHVLGLELPINPLVLGIVAAMLFGALIVLYMLVKINEGQRIVTINYAKRVHGNSSYGGVKSILPMKLITAGVIPVIFAIAFLSLPAFVGQILNSAGVAPDLANNLTTWFQAPNAGSFTGETWQAFIYPVAYFLLVVGFTYFYTSIVFNSAEIADNLQKQGGFIEGVRPGHSTEVYLTKTVNRLNLFGALSLGLIAMLPFVADYLLYSFAGVQNSNLSISGTGLLIVVTVALENLRQLNSRALMVTYGRIRVGLMTLRVARKLQITLRTLGGILLVGLAVCLGLVAYNEYNMDHNRPERERAQATVAPKPEVDETIPTEQEVTEWKVAANKPRYISIPSLGVRNARVREVGVQADGKLGTPYNIFDTAWYNGSALPGSGSGALLIDGHNGGPTMSGVFKKLSNLSTGSTISIERGDGEILNYTVLESIIKTVEETDAYMANMLQSADPAKEGLNLITCTGTWDNAHQTYDKRAIIRAVIE